MLFRSLGFAGQRVGPAQEKERKQYGSIEDDEVKGDCVKTDEKTRKYASLIYAVVLVVVAVWCGEFAEKRLVASFIYCFIFPLGLRSLLQSSWDCRKEKVVIMLLCCAAGACLMLSVRNPRSPSRRLAYGGISLLVLGLWLPMLRDGFFVLNPTAHKRKGNKKLAEAAARRARESSGCVAVYLVFAAIFFLAASSTPNARCEELRAYYAWLAAVAIVGIAATKSTLLRHRLSLTVSRFATVGEILFWCSLVCFIVYLLILTAKREENTSRFLGRLSNSILGLLLLPVARNSALSAALHISYSHLLRFHILLGYLFLLLAFGHAVLALIATPKARHMLVTALIAPEHEEDTLLTRSDLPVSIATVPLMILVLFLALVLSCCYILRNRFHHLSIALVLATLWHAPDAWFYVMGGLALYIVDLGIRFAKAKSVTLLDASLEDRGRLIRLEYSILPPAKSNNEEAIMHIYESESEYEDDSPNTTAYPITNEKEIQTIFVVKSASYLLGSPAEAKKKSELHNMQHNNTTEADSFDAGQFAWIRIPSVLGNDWFGPVYYSSNPLQADASTLHIPTNPEKQMHWSSKLAQAVKRMNHPSEKLTDLQIDGPYGIPLQPLVLSKRRLLIVAGGAGITPCASLLEALKARPQADHYQRVRLLWVAKRREFFTAFNHLGLSGLLTAPITAPFSAILFDTFQPEHEPFIFSSEQAYLATIAGRPDLGREALALLDGLENPQDALILASGPPGLVRYARSLAQQLDTSFYSVSSPDGPEVSFCPSVARTTNKQAGNLDSSISSSFFSSWRWRK